MSFLQISHISYVYLFVGSILFTYFIVSGFLYWYIYIYKPGVFRKYKIQQEKPSKQSVIHDISWSLLTMSIWAVFVYFLVVLTNHGYTKVYFSLDGENELIYGFFVVMLFFVLHDTYYYWVHRLMHSHDLIYKYAHEVHHTTTNPTPLSIFAFSPIEAMFHGLYFTLICFIVPIHFYAVVVVFTLNSIVNIIGHTGFEFFSLPLTKFLEKMIVTPIKHNAHHSYGYKNYGLYFAFWDDVMGTRHKNYDNDVTSFFSKRK